MKNIFNFFTIFLVILLIGCARQSFLEPSGYKESLVVGLIEFHGIEYDRHEATQKITSKDITITLQNILTGEKFIAETKRKFGLFSVNVPSNSDYKILKLEWDYYINPQYKKKLVGYDPGFKLSVGAGKVINIGQLDWRANEAAGKYNIMEQSVSWNKTKKSFSDTYKKSLWNNLQWVNTELKPTSKQ